MKKLVSLLLVAVIALGVFAGCGSKQAESESTDSAAPDAVISGTASAGGELNLYTWAGMFPDDVLREFEDETGIRINYSNFDFNETMHSKLQADGGASYDLIIGDDYILQNIIEEGLAQKLDTSKIPNFGNINPIYQGQFYDPNNEYTVPYGSGVQTIVYNPEAPGLENIDVKGYADLWGSEFEDNLGMVANYRVVDGIALMVMGESLNTEDVAKIAAAGEKLYELAPNVRLVKDDNLQDDLISGEISAAMMYTSQVTLAKKANPNLKVVFPEEGIGFGIMGQFIPAKAPNPDAAHAFINFILDPEISARCFEEFGYYCTNKAAEEYLDEESREMLTIPEEFLDNMEMMKPISLEANDAHTDVWTKFMELI